MKLNFTLPIAALFFGMLASGQDTKNTMLFSANESIASNQTQWNNENDVLRSLKQQDSTKVKELRDVPWFVNRFQVSLGYFGGYSNTSVRLDSHSGDIGTNIDFESDLGYNVYSSSIFADLQFRSSSRSRFMLSYYNLRRDSSHKIDRTFEFGENTYEINSEIYSYLNVDVYRFSYGYAIFSKPKYEVGLSIGTHIIGFDLGIGLRGENLNVEASDNYNLTAPLPDFGIWGGYALSDKFALNGEIDYFAVKVDEVDGRVQAYNFSGTYKVLKNLNLTAAFTSLNCRVDALKTRGTASVVWGNEGFSLKASYTFGKNTWK